MDHDDHPGLALSDVVHDDTIADDPEIDPPNPLPSDFSVEMLEREIATLLSQNASAASAALLSAAAQQRQAHMALQPLAADAPAPADNISSLNLNLTGLAAMLQAAQAQAAENERVAEELAAKDPDYARQRDAAIADKGQKSTKTAPAFHSLTAGEPFDIPPRKRSRVEIRTASEGSDYLFADGDSASDPDDLDRAHNGKMTVTLSPSRTRPGTPPDPSPPVHSEFSDISDILTQLSAQFEQPAGPHPQDLSASDPSPVVSRVHARDPQPQPQPPPPVLAPSNRAPVPQPVASTSSIYISSPPKKGKKAKDKDKGTHVHTCEQEQCQKSFTRRSDLARHMRIHTGERPFICEYDGCGKTFIQRSALHVHSRVHTGEKPHSCEYPGCGKTFGDSSSLARHRRTHTGKRPYKCEDPACEKTFTRRTTLTTHMKTHDPAWEPNPTIKYNFKGKRRKVNDDDDDQELAESVRTISALFQAGGNAMLPTSGNPLQDETLEVRVASISAEIAAAIAQAQSRVYDDDDDEEDEDDQSGSDNAPEMIIPNTSGIRGLDGLDKDGRRFVEEDDDSDAFPVPLRARKSRELAFVGSKRKR